MNKVKVGIIGAGKMGMLHSCLFNKLKDSELVAICDITPMNLRLIRSAFPKVARFDDYSVMIKECTLDLVVVTTPVFLHKRMAQMALEAGSAVFVEKPLALNAEECHVLETLSKDKITFVGYCRRFMATYNKAKELIDGGSLGRLVSFDSHMFVTQSSDDRSSWQFDARRSGGGVVMDLGSHGIDMVHYLLGDIVEVSATTEQDLETTVEDASDLQFVLKDGQSGRMTVSWTRPGFRLPELLLNMVFEKGRIMVCEKYLEIAEFDKDGLTRKYYKQMLEKGVQINIAGQEYTREDEHLISAIKNGMRTRCDFSEAAKTNYVIESAYRSMRRSGDKMVVGYEQ